MPSDDPFRDDPTVKKWVHHVLDEMAPKMEESAFVMQLVPTGEHSEGDVKFWVELGASIMMNKPILAIAVGSDANVPPKLRQIADEIVVLPEGVNAEGSEELQEAMKRLMRRIEEGENAEG